MFKFKSYNIKKAEENNDKTSKPSNSTSTPSYLTGTLKKTTNKTTSSSSSSSSRTTTYVSPKQKTMPSTKEIKAVNNKQSPEYSRKIYPKNTVTDWQTNKTFTAEKDTKKVVIPSPHKKLERK